MLVDCDDKHTKSIKRLISKVCDEEPFSALGFFSIDRSMLTSLLANILTYLIILIQFNVPASPQEIEGTSENETNYDIGLKGNF